MYPIPHPTLPRALAQVNRNTTLSGGAAITGATTITGSAVITGPTTLTALDGQVALTIKGDNAVPVTTALVVDGNVQVGANSNGLRRNLVVTGESSFGSGLPGTPVAVKTWGGLLVNGHLQAGTSDIKGDSIGEWMGLVRVSWMGQGCPVSAQQTPSVSG